VQTGERNLDDGASTLSSGKGINVREIAERFWRFDKLIGGSLVKVAYYLGLVGIGLWLVAAVITAFEISEISGDAAVGGFLSKVVIAIVATIFWRFTCEISLMMFQIFDRLGEIRDRLPPQ
jgi:hypothetical protein